MPLAPTETSDWPVSCDLLPTHAAASASECKVLTDYSVVIGETFFTSSVNKFVGNKQAKIRTFICNQKVFPFENISENYNS